MTECTALPGVSGNATGEMFPGDYKLSGDDADALANCLNAVPGAKIDRTEGSPADGPGLAAFIARCVGVENLRPAPEYVGLIEDEATRIKQPEYAGGVNSVRVVGRDGDCLGRTRAAQRPGEPARRGRQRGLGRTLLTVREDQLMGKLREPGPRLRFCSPLVTPPPGRMAAIMSQRSRRPGAGRVAVAGGAGHRLRPRPDCPPAHPEGCPHSACAVVSGCSRL